MIEWDVHIEWKLPERGGCRRDEEGHITTTLSNSKEIGAYEGFSVLTFDPTTILSSGKKSHCIYYDNLAVFFKMNIQQHRNDDLTMN